MSPFDSVGRGLPSDRNSVPYSRHVSRVVWRYCFAGKVIDLVERSMWLIAYIDVNLGSMLIQAFAGTAFAGLVMGRRLLTVPLEWLRSRRAETERDLTQDDQVEDELLTKLSVK